MPLISQGVGKASRRTVGRRLRTILIVGFSFLIFSGAIGVSDREPFTTTAYAGADECDSPAGFPLEIKEFDDDVWQCVEIEGVGWEWRPYGSPIGAAFLPGEASPGTSYEQNAEAVRVAPSALSWQPGAYRLRVEATNEVGDVIWQTTSGLCSTACSAGTTTLGLAHNQQIYFKAIILSPSGRVIYERSEAQIGYCA